MNIEEYLDNNNYIQLNEIETKENRLVPYGRPNEYSFLTYRKTDRWVGHININNNYQFVTQSGAIKKEKVKILFATYFFLDGERFEHQREFMNAI